MTKTLVIGATSSLAFALCHELAKQGDELIVAGRDEQELQNLRQDILIRYDVSTSTLLCDLDTNEFDVKSFCNDLPHIDRVIMMAGYMGNDVENDVDDQRRIMNVNFHSPEAILHALANQFIMQKSGDVVIISSVAGDCIRKKNHHYSLAKSKLGAYGKTLRKRLKLLDINVLTVKPGFIDTPMTYGMKSPLMASREHVAQAIIQAMNNKQNTLYTPFFWRYIMLVLKTLPTWLINKLGI